MFSGDEDVKQAMNGFVVVSLFTDRSTEECLENARLREELTGSTTNPLYVMRDSFDDKILSVADYNQAGRDSFDEMVEKAGRRFKSRQRRRGQ